MNQKHRTRELLLEVAADLIRRGESFSISDVADLAKVGRTTAYRYFPTADLLVAHAALWRVAGQEYNEAVDRAKDGGTPYDKVDAVVIEFDRATNKHQNEFRAMLRVSLQEGIGGGGHRGRIRYFALKKALDGLQESLGKSEFERLVCAICLTVGIESQIVLKDICLLSADKAREVKRWAAKSLLQVAFAEVSGAIGKNKKARQRTSGTFRSTRHRPAR